MPGPYSRRAFLGVLGALGATAALSGCRGADHVPQDSGAASSAASRTGGSGSGPAGNGSSGGGSSGGAAGLGGGSVSGSGTGSGTGAAGGAAGTGGGSPSASSPATRTVQTAGGPVQVPAAPTRVVVLGTAELDSAFTLGFTPVGAARPALDHGLPDYFPAAWYDPVQQIGTVGAPDPGAVARLRPDLILGNRATDGARYHHLASIAPTVLTESTGASWKQDFRLHAQALNAQSIADAVTGAYDDHVRQVTAALGGSGTTRKQQISVLHFVEGEDPRVIGTGSFLGTLLADVQLGRPASQSSAAGSAVPSASKLALADGSAIFYATYGDPTKAHTTEMLNSPEWRALGAVRARRAFPVDDQLWFQGVGYFGANLILAQLQRHLGG